MLNLFKKPQTTPTAKVSYAEIVTCGFLPGSYLAYCSGNYDRKGLCSRADGTRMVSFSNGDVIVEFTAGQLIVIDRNGRVVLVRVLQSDIPENGPKCSLDRASMVKVLFSNGVRETRIPGGLVVLTSSAGFDISQAGRTILNFMEGSCSAA